MTKLEIQYREKVAQASEGRVSLVDGTYQGADKPAQWFCSKHGVEFTRTPYQQAKTKGCKRCGAEAIAAARVKPVSELTKHLPAGFTVEQFTSLYAPAVIRHDLTGEVFHIRNVSQAIHSNQLPHHLIERRDVREALARTRPKRRREVDQRKVSKRKHLAALKRVAQGRSYDYRQGLRMALVKSLAEKFPGALFDVSGYRNRSSTLRVWCSIHGWQSASKASTLARQHACPACAPSLGGLKGRRSFESFVDEATVVHKGRYTYLRDSFKSMSEPATAHCSKHGHFKVWPSNHLLGDGCAQCSGQVSTEEVKLRAAVMRRYRGPLKLNDRSFGKELDIYAPDLGLAVEYDGIWWHSSKYRSEPLARKQRLFAAKGIRTIHIFSDEWSDRTAAVKRLLDRLFQVPSPRVFARKCEVVAITTAQARDFLERNHVQGWARGDYSGLSYDGVLVAVLGMSQRGSSRNSREDGEAELVRYATSIEVVGGASKLFANWLRDNPEVARVVSFSDNRLFTGGMYPKLGFTLDREMPPDYTYTRGSTGRLHKSGFQRARLAKKWPDFDPSKSERENCEAHGYYRVYDCGKKRWVWERPT